MSNHCSYEKGDYMTTVATILTAFTAVLTAIVGGIGDFAGLVLENELLLIGVGMTVGFAALGIVRSFIKH